MSFNPKEYDKRDENMASRAARDRAWLQREDGFRTRQGGESDAGRTPTAGEQYREHSASLIALLVASSYLPEDLTSIWADTVAGMQLERPHAGLETLESLVTQFEQAYTHYVPRPHVFDLSAATAVHYQDEMQAIRHELQWLDALFRHVIALTS